MTNNEDWKLKLAKKRVKKVKGFYGHLSTWLVFCAFFLLLNLATDRNNFWAFWPIAGWGLGVVFHAIGVFGLPGLGKDWEERMLEREMARMDSKESQNRNTIPAGRLPQSTRDAEDGLELKEVKKAWRDSDLV